MYDELWNQTLSESEDEVPRGFKKVRGQGQLQNLCYYSPVRGLPQKRSADFSFLFYDSNFVLQRKTAVITLTMKLRKISATR